MPLPPPTHPLPEATWDSLLYDQAYGVLTDSLADIGLLVCIRAWSAWSAGTMTGEDFMLVSEDPDLIHPLLQGFLQGAGDSDAEQALWNAWSSEDMGFFPGGLSAQVRLDDWQPATLEDVLPTLAALEPFRQRFQLQLTVPDAAQAIARPRL